MLVRALRSVVQKTINIPRRRKDVQKKALLWLLQTMRVGFRALHKEAERRTGPKMADSTSLKITAVIAFVKTVRSTSAMVLAPYSLTVNTYISMVGRTSTHGFRLRETG